MSESIARLAGRVLDDYLGNRHLLYLLDDLNAIASVANFVSAMATQASASSSAAAATYALNLDLGISAYGIGTDALLLPRAGALGSAAFFDDQFARGIITNLQNAAYQITLHDYGKLLLDTSGTNTYTLPAATDLPEAWWCLYMNFSGANLTLSRSGADTINAAATSVTVASGAAVGRIIRRSSSTFLIG